MSLGTSHTSSIGRFGSQGTKTVFLVYSLFVPTWMSQEVDGSMVRINGLLDGGFKYVLFSSLFGNMIQLDEYF